MEEVWGIAQASFKVALKKHPCDIGQFVLMGNHYHLLVKTPKQNLDLFMYEFGKHFSLQLRRATGLINRMFGGRYKWSIITSNEQLMRVFRYIYQNPLRASLASSCEKYPFSTLYFELDNRNNTNHKRGDSFINRQLLPPFTVNAQMQNWLNEKVHIDEEQGIQMGLAKSHYKFVTRRRY